MKKHLNTLLILLLIALMVCACGNKQAKYQEQYDLGVKYLSEGNYEEAIIAFEAAIKIEPKQAAAYVGRGNAYIFSAETEEMMVNARRDYELALSFDDSNIDAYLGLADLLIRQGKYDDALELLHQSLDKTNQAQAMLDKIAEIESGNIYDLAGKSRRMSVYGANGQLSWYLERYYDASNRIASVTSYTPSGEEINSVDISYDEQGRMLDGYGWDVQTGVLNHIRYVYDDNGNMLESWTYIQNRESTIRHAVFEYDSSGKKQAVYTYDSNDNLFAYSLYEYDKVGNAVRENMYSADGTLRGYVLRSYDVNGKMTTQDNYDATGRLTSHTDY